jgi:hypothetical protein
MCGPDEWAVRKNLLTAAPSARQSKALGGSGWEVSSATAKAGA